MGKKWDEFWKRFDTTMDALPDAIDEMVDKLDSMVAGSGCGVYDVHSVDINNGEAILTGRFKSIRINGFLIKVPAHVLEGKPRPDVSSERGN